MGDSSSDEAMEASADPVISGTKENANCTEDTKAHDKDDTTNSNTIDEPQIKEEIVEEDVKLENESNTEIEEKGEKKGATEKDAKVEKAIDETESEISTTATHENLKETENGNGKPKSNNFATHKSKKRARNQDQYQHQYTNNAATNALIQNLQSILFDLSTQHNNTSPVPGANTTLPIHPNVFATSISSTSISNVITANSSTSPNRLPTLQQVITNTTKAIHDCPPWVHLSHRDAAPQLKIDDAANNGKRLTVKGGGGASSNSSNCGSASGNGVSNGSSHANTNSNNYSSTGGSTTGTNTTSTTNTEHDSNLIRGYRMVRASHGVSEGTAFFEVIINAPPSGHEIVSSLPPHVRLGEKLQSQLKQKILYEQKQEQIRLQKQQENNAGKGSTGTSVPCNGSDEKLSSIYSSSSQPPSSKKQKLSTLLDISSTKQQTEQLRAKIYHKKMQMLGGHVRLGWSMRTGELQAPVGYDRWSYGIRDINSSRIHDSKRHDSWAGGEMASFGPGDVIGVAISLKGGTQSNSNLSLNQPPTTDSSKKRNQIQPTTNEIRFFKNGLSLGQILVSRNVRSGGAAFEHIQDGTYYPAISVYMGGNVRVNFGPHFVYPIQTSQLSTAIKKLRPMSDLCQTPKSPEDVMEWAKKEKEKVVPKGKGGSTASSVNASEVDAIIGIFERLVETDARMRYEAYENHLKSHVEEIKKARQKRGLSFNF